MVKSTKLVSNVRLPTVQGAVYQVVVPGKPGTKQRSRSTKAGHHFTPRQTVVAESWIRLCCVQQAGTPMLAGPVTLTIGMVLEPPSSMRVTQRQEALAGLWLPVCKPDWDNTGKLVGDALNGIGWRDDARVSLARVVKAYGDEPRLVIRWWDTTADEAARELAAAGIASAETLRMVGAELA